MIIKYQSDIYESFEDKLCAGWMKMTAQEATPLLRWKGPKIDIPTVWWPLVAWFHKHQKHEVQAHFIMDTKETIIKPFVYKQTYGTGMSTKETNDTKEEQEWLDKKGFINIGSSHSHCTASAFASGTDKENEAKQVGLHCTVGHLDKAQFDLHFRMTWLVSGTSKENPARYVTLEPVLKDWFDIPDYFGEKVKADPGLELLILKYLLSQPPPADTQYPKIWDSKLIEEKYTYTPPSTTGPRSNAPWIHGGGYDGTQGARDWGDYYHPQSTPTKAARPLFEDEPDAAEILADRPYEPGATAQTIEILEDAKDELRGYLRDLPQWLGFRTFWDFTPSKELDLKCQMQPLVRSAFLKAEGLLAKFGIKSFEHFFSYFEEAE